MEHHQFEVTREGEQPMVVFQRALRELKEVTMSSESVGNTNTTHVCNAEVLLTCLVKLLDETPTCY